MTQENSTPPPTTHPSSIPLSHYLSAKSTILAIGITCLVAVISTSIAGVSNRKGMELDQKRLEDFSNIQSEIEDYYADNYELPRSFYDLDKPSSLSPYEKRILDSMRLPEDDESEQTATYRNDPETNKPYEYKILSQYSYQLCTTFSTEKTNRNDSDSYYDRYSEKTNHTKGYNCITYTIPEYDREGYSDYEDDYEYEDETEPITFITPQDKETLCLGQPFTIEWEADSTISSVQLSLYDGFGKTYLLKPYTKSTTPQISPTILPTVSPIFPGVSFPVISRQKGSHTWIVGDTFSGKKLESTANKNYNFEAEVISPESTNSYYESDYFKITDCENTSTPTPAPMQRRLLLPTSAPLRRDGGLILESQQKLNNTLRRSDTVKILNAIGAYYAENKGSLPSGINTTARFISNSQANLCSQLVPDYLTELPLDPSFMENEKTGITDCSNPYTTGYQVQASSNDIVTVSAPYAELEETISVSR